MKSNGVASLPNGTKLSASNKDSVSTQLPVDVPESCHLQQNHGATAGANATPMTVNVKRMVIDVMYNQGSVLHRLSPYLVALRPWSFTASLGPVALGSCLAYKALGAFNVWIFVVTCICALSVHAAGNLVNTYIDFAKGVDSKKSDDRTLVDRLLVPADVVYMGAVCYIVGCIGLLILTILSPTPLPHLALVYFGGLSASFLYTGGLGLKYIALGDVAIILTFGPVTVLFAYMSQGGGLSWVPLIYAIPLALNTEAILHSNNTRDVETDKEAGIVTLAILAGRTGSYIIFVVLLFSPYIIFAVLTANVSQWFIIPLVTILYTFDIERKFRRDDLLRMPVVVAKLNVKLAAAYVAACFLTDRALLPGLS